MTFTEWHDDTLLTADNFGSNTEFSQIRECYNTLRMNENATRADWDAWYQSLVPYFQAQNIFIQRYNNVHNIRKDAVDLMLLALFGGEHTLKSKYHLPDEEKAYRRTRYHWVFQKAMEAHEHYPDVMTYFIKNLKNRDGDKALKHLVLNDLNELLKNTPPYVNPDLIRAMLIYHEPVNDDYRVSDDVSYQWIKLLDDEALVVAAAAAYCLGERSNLLYNSRNKLIDIITQKELERPGIAGAFYSPHHFDCDLFLGEDRWIKTVEWMMDLMERRKGKPEFGPNLDVTLNNDISFYLHELCDCMPDMVERMIDNGFDDLAIMTATEQNAKIDGMEKPLKTLANNEHPRIAEEAREYLEKYYQ